MSKASSAHEYAVRPHTFRHRAVWSGAMGAFAVTYGWFHGLWREPFLQGLGKSAEEIAAADHTAYEASVLQFAGNLVTAYTIAWLLRHFAVGRLVEGLTLTFILWIGLIAAIATPLFMAAGFPLYFLAICAGGVLAQMLVIATVTSIWRP